MGVYIPTLPSALSARICDATSWVKLRSPPIWRVIVMVCSDKDSRKLWLAPLKPWVEADCLNIRFVAFGILFRTMMGYRMPQLFHDMSCTSPRKCLFYGNAQHRVKDIFRSFEQGRAASQSE
jgi:hypothetical protein